MRKVKFLKNHKPRNMIFYHYYEGDVKELNDDYATALIDAGVAKSLDSPHKHKMVERPTEKKHYHVG